MSLVHLLKSGAECGEDAASGLTGPPCPFCGARCTELVATTDRRGVLDATWACRNCGESGPMAGRILHLDLEAADAA